MRPNVWAQWIPGGEKPRWPPHEGITFARVEDFEIAYNILGNGDKEGIDCKGPCKRGTIHNNEVFGLERVAIYIDAWTQDSEDIDIYDNIMYDCAMGVAVNSEDDQSVYNVNVHHNLMYNLKNLGFTIGSYQTARVENANYYNNTIASTQRGYIIDPSTFESDVYNNLFYNLEGDVVKDGLPPAVNNVIIDSELNGGAEILFEDVLNNDFHLSPGSPAIDAGRSGDAYNDADGTRGDIGAFSLAMNTSFTEAPSQLSANATGFNSIDLAWTDNSTHEEGFIIERKLKGYQFEEIFRVGRDVTSFTDYTLLQNSKVEYRVRAYNNASETSRSNVASAVSNRTEASLCTPMFYSLTVENGTQSEWFEKEAKVNISASTPPVGEVF